MIIIKWKKREAKYTLNNEVCIYAVGFFGLALLNPLQVPQKQIKRVFSWCGYYCFMRRLAKLNLLKISNTKTKHILIYIYLKNCGNPPRAFHLVEIFAINEWTLERSILDGLNYKN